MPARGRSARIAGRSCCSVELADRSRARAGTTRRRRRRRRRRSRAARGRAGRRRRRRSRSARRTNTGASRPSSSGWSVSALALLRVLRRLPSGAREPGQDGLRRLCYRSTLVVNGHRVDRSTTSRSLVENEPRRALELAPTRPPRRLARRGARRPRCGGSSGWPSARSATCRGRDGRSTAARRAGAGRRRPALAARVAISLALEVGHVGDIRAAVALLAAVEADVDDRDRPLLHNQRGVFHYRTGRLDDAVAALQRRATGDGGRGSPDRPAGAREPRARSSRSAVEYDESRAALAARGHARPSSSTRSAWASLALANLAYVETVEGNLPEAIDAYVSAEDGYRQTGDQADLPRLYADHASALADANLLDDAEHLIDRGRRDLGGRRQRPRARRAAARLGRDRPRQGQARRGPRQRRRRRRRVHAGRDATAGCTSPSACGCAPRRA